MEIHYLRTNYHIGHQMEVFVQTIRNHVTSKLTVRFKIENDNYKILLDTNDFDMLKINPYELEKLILDYLKK